jgi:hypothetical protein
MIAARREIAGAGANGGDDAALGMADWLSLSAAPGFAIMALLTEVFGQRDMLCLATRDPVALSGMTAMYLLMSVVHLAPWIRLITVRRNGTRRS